jgi:hypothetical protein
MKFKPFNLNRLTTNMLNIHEDDKLLTLGSVIHN